MSVLTWRDVATPDLSGAAQAQAAAQRAMNDAFNSAQGMLQGVKDLRAEAADRNIINRSLQYQTPEQLQAAIANGSVVGPDGQYAHAATLKALPDQVSAMLNNALTSANTGQKVADTGYIDSQTTGLNQTNQQTAYSNARLQASNARIDAAAPLLNEGLATVTDVPSMQAAQAKLINDPRYKAMLPEEQSKFLSDFNSTINTKLGGSNAVFDTNQKLTDAVRNELVKTHVAQISEMGTTQAARDALDKISDPVVHAAVEEKIAPNFPGLSTKAQNLDQLAQPIVGLGNTTPNWYNNGAYGNMGIRGVDGKPLNYADVTISDAMTHGMSMIDATKKPLTDDKGNAVKDAKGNIVYSDGTSAQTPFMFTNTTLKDLGPQVFKDTPGGWQNTKLTPENQQKLAAAILNTVHTPEQLIGRWTSLKDHPDWVKTIADNGYNPVVANPLIIASENGKSLTDVQSMMFDTYNKNLTASSALAQASSQTGVSDYNKYATLADADTKTISKELQSDPALAGAKPAYIDQLIQEGKNHVASNLKDANGKPYQISNGLAALALKISMVPDTTGSSAANFFHNITPGSDYHRESTPTGYHVDAGTYNRNLEYMASSKAKQDAAAYEAQNEGVNKIGTTQKAYQDKLAQAQQAAANFMADPKKPGVSDAYKVAMEQLTGARTLMDKVLTDSTGPGGRLNAQYPVTPPPPPPGPSLIHQDPNYATAFSNFGR